MTYRETIAYLYNVAPLFQQVGAGAYKEGLSNTRALDDYFHHPHRQFKSIHIGGTNGKGSTSHTLSAILQSAGYKVGLYTSPHLIDFRERIRVNGEMVSEEFVINFVAQHRASFEPLSPSFFELTTAMAFLYFAQQKVDFAIIEVGLGGRLDCTNIISPLVSLITNISLDHTALLGNTLAEIAGEKAGIIKPNTPVIISESTAETLPVFLSKAEEMRAPITFVEEDAPIIGIETTEDGRFRYLTRAFGSIEGELRGNYQQKNMALVLSAVAELRRQGIVISDDAVRRGMAQVTALTGLMGRWQVLHERPMVVCDTGHNIGGMQYLVEQISQQTYKKLHIVIGMVNDKDVNGVLALLPTEANYYFTQASVQRALPAEVLQGIALSHGLNGACYDSVEKAYRAALSTANPQDFIFVGGSTFIVADLLAAL